MELFLGFAPPKDSDALFLSLRQTYAADDLLAAGIGITTTGDEPRLGLNPALRESTVLPVRQTSDGPPSDLIVGTGSLRHEVPLVAMANDWRSRAPGSRQLFLAETLDDVAILTRLGFMATTTVGLDQLGRRSLTAVCETFGWTRGLGRETAVASAQENRPAPLSLNLVLVGWDLAMASADPPVRYQAVVRHLRRLRRELDVDIPQIACWTVDAYA